jgi:hypothetical protein
VTSLLGGEGPLYWLLIASPSTPFTAFTQSGRCGKTRTLYPLCSTAPLAVLSCLMILHSSCCQCFTANSIGELHCESLTLRPSIFTYPYTIFPVLPSLYCPSYSPDCPALSLYKLDSDSVQHTDSVGLDSSD